jgi:hypothetical protein
MQFLDKRCGIKKNCWLDDDYILEEIWVYVCIIGFMYYSIWRKEPD